MLQQKVSTSEQDCEQLTLLVEDSHASHFPWLESKKVKGTIVTCGQKCSELSESLSRVGSLVRMYLESSKLPGKQFVRTWSVRDTLSPFLIMKLRLSVQNTDEKECSLSASAPLWKTPVTADANNREFYRNSRGEPNLSAQVKVAPNGPPPRCQRMWPTPHANCGNGMMWPTIRAGSNRNSRNAIVGKNTGGKHKSDMGLEQAAEVLGGILPRELETPDELPPRFQKLWVSATARDSRPGDAENRQGGKSLVDTVTFPTTTARDYRSADINPATKHFQAETELNTVVALHPTLTPPAIDYKDYKKDDISSGEGVGQLNPDWVELLMGFPLNWTSLNKKTDKEEWFQNTESNLNPWSRDWERDIPRTAKGVKYRVDRIKCLGNAVVPQQIYPIFKAIFEVENEQRKINQPSF